MLNTQHTLVLYEGMLCIRSVMTDSYKPEFMVDYWPCFKCSRNDAEMNGYPIGARMESAGNGDGVYTPVYGVDDRRRYALQDYGRTHAIHRDVIPITPPKTKVETRWYLGQWQKYLKSKGWVNLGVDFSPLD